MTAWGAALAQAAVWLWEDMLGSPMPAPGTGSATPSWPCHLGSLGPSHRHWGSAGRTKFKTGCLGVRGGGEHGMKEQGEPGCPCDPTVAREAGKAVLFTGHRPGGLHAGRAGPEATLMQQPVSIAEPNSAHGAGEAPPSQAQPRAGRTAGGTSWGTPGSLASVQRAPWTPVAGPPQFAHL